jgi:putative protease
MKPELLLPAGSPEAFIAALEGGADAVYLGLQNFNARGRAKNFQITNLPALVKTAASYKAKIYLTLNTLIKNNELTKLLEYLTILQDYSPAAIIIQDWGVYYFLQKYFPRLNIHASTQMGNHNSLDCQYAYRQHFQRVILARELSLAELTTIAEQSQIELEIFAHGALCYSFSGSCLFSSWAGGMSANRGQCKQPCRHQFVAENTAERWFSMKDFELIGYLPELTKLGIKAVKIEGRMRSADYVNTVARAYRMALDYPERLAEAKQMLLEDGGRDKTDWFFPGKSTFSTTGNSFTGKGIGTIISNKDGYIGIELIETLKAGTYLRFQTTEDMDSEALQADKIYIKKEDKLIETTNTEAGQTIYLKAQLDNLPLNSIVYQTKHISTSKWNYKPETTKIPFPDEAKIRHRLGLLYKQVASEPLTKHTELYFRIDDPAWLPLLKEIKTEGIFCPLEAEIVQTYGVYLIPELPFFVSEADLPDVQIRVKQLLENNIRTFCLSRLSQSIWFLQQSKAKLFTSEKVYCLNDAAIAQVKQAGILQWVLPLENDFPNLISSKNREGIVPLYFHPGLFYSRQDVFNKEMHLAHDKQKLVYRQDAKMVTVSPEQAVCNFSFYPRLVDKSYRRFLIDLSGVEPDSGFLQNLMQHLEQGKNIEGTKRFNMKQGLW